MRRSFYLRVISGLAIGVLLLAGCGKKGDPIPARMVIPPAIADLSAVSRGEGIVLRWSQPHPPGAIGSFRILRSEAAAADACPGCPQDHRTLVLLSKTDSRLQRDGETIRYFDAAVRPGRFYSYRVAVCDSRGNCGEASNTAQRVHEKP